MPCLGRQFLWIERGVGGAHHCRHCGALEGHPGPLRLLPRHPPQVLVFQQGIVLKFYDCHYWLGKKMMGGRDLPKAFKHNINQSFCSWEKLAVPFLCKDAIKSHFLACQYSYIKKKKKRKQLFWNSSITSQTSSAFPLWIWEVARKSLTAKNGGSHGVLPM